MKNTTLRQRLFMLAVLLALLGPGYASAQQTDFRVGAEVEIFCECPGRSGWTKGRVESIERVGPTNVFKVRYISDPAHTKRVLPGKIRDPKLHQQQQAQLGKEKAEADMRAAFFRETHTPHYASVRSMMMVHDMDLVDGSSKSGPPVDPKEWDKVVSDLAALDNLCKTKYAGMVNS